MPRKPHAPAEGFGDAPKDPTYADVQLKDTERNIYVPVGEPHEPQGIKPEPEAKRVLPPNPAFTTLNEPTARFSVSTTDVSAASNSTEEQHKRVYATDLGREHQAKKREREERHKAHKRRERRKPKPEYVERDGFDISDKVVWGTLASFVTAGFLGFIETTYGLPAPEGADVFLSGALVAIAGSVVAYFKRERV